MPVDATTGRTLSKLGTLTPKDFSAAIGKYADELPTGVWDYQRVELHTLFPQLGRITLRTYYLLRIACCGRMLVKGADKLEDCYLCKHNCGFVCPMCLGKRWLTTGEIGYNALTACNVCCYSYVDDKQKVRTEHDPMRELIACQNWLAKRFPMGVPQQPTERERAIMDGAELYAPSWYQDAGEEVSEWRI